MKKYDIIIENDASICYNRKASTLSALKTGGVISVLITPTSINSLIVALDNTCSDRYVLGKMTNTLISDHGIDREVIVTSAVKGVHISDNILSCATGESLSSIAVTACKLGLSGLECLCGIPGTIGGALSMNAGAFGRYMSDIVVSARVYLDGKVVDMSADQLKLSYRHSSILDSNGVILQVDLRLKQSCQSEILTEMSRVRAIRQAIQPLEISLGSVFKRHLDKGAGYYIEGCGLKGYRVGGCEVSAKHANFIVNTSRGSSTDYYNIIQHIERCVLDKYNIILEREVRLIGEFEREI